MSLEKKLAHLEDKINRMIPLLDEEKDPFAYLSVVQDWTREQVDLIFSLMKEAEAVSDEDEFFRLRASCSKHHSCNEL